MLVCIIAKTVQYPRSQSSGIQRQNHQIFKFWIGKMKRPESGLSLEASLLVFRLRFAKLLIILSIIVVQSP